MRKGKSPEWLGNGDENDQSPPEEVKDKPMFRNPKFAVRQPNHKLLIDDAQPSNFRFYNIDRRQPKINKDSDYQEVNPFANLNDSQGSMEESRRVRRLRRPASNQIDRFGRIAFNRQKEISQASLEVPEPSNPEDAKKPDQPQLNMGHRSGKRYQHVIYS